ncbi:GntR family transcriptional regulator [Janthinobacterium sp. SUN176]|nr:GntR family transcriptional regulator [Janthinobacterium sp. SUN176]
MRVAEALQAAVAEGPLTPGDRLPLQRRLAARVRPPRITRENHCQLQ